jgi:hypothetical protein
MGGVHKVNAGFTVLLRVRAECVDAASTLLAQLHADQARLPFARSSTTHFATLTIVPAQTWQDEPLPPTLLFATSFCGPARAHAAELVDVMGAGLRAVFAHCEDFDVGCDDEELEEFLLEHRSADTFYSGMQNLSPDDVRKQCQLRDAIETYIDEQQERGGMRGTALEVRTQLQDFVIARPDLAWAREPVEWSFMSWLIVHWRSLLVEAGVGALVACTIAGHFIQSDVLRAIVIGGWIALGVFLVFLLVLLATIREAEDNQAYLSTRAPDERARMLAATTVRPVINEFTLAGPIKQEGSLRPLFLRLSLWVIARGVEGVPGIPFLSSGISIPTVATARWIAADGGRRAIFISNFTNEGKAYVRDFIETTTGAMRINLTFGFGLGFPATRWVILDGALSDPNTYLHSLAENQMPTMFWYGPYRDISIDNIKRNRKIREGLFADLDEQEARDWLLLL